MDYLIAAHLSLGDSYSLKFNESGTYNYFCTIHPWMEGIVTC